MTLDKKFISRRIRELAEQRGISLYQIEKESGLSRSTVSNAANEENCKLPSLDTLDKICKVLDVTPSDFFRDDDDRYELSTLEGEIIESTRKCNAEGRVRIEAYAKGISEGLKIKYDV